MKRRGVGGPMPTANQLIERLLDESRHFVKLAIVIGYEKETILIWNDNPDPLRELNGHIGAGGIPFAMMGYVATSEGYRFYAKLLKDYERDPSFKTILNKTLEDIRQQLEAKGFETK